LRVILSYTYIDGKQQISLINLTTRTC